MVTEMVTILYMAGKIMFTHVFRLRWGGEGGVGGGGGARDYLKIKSLNPKEREHFFAFYTGCLFEEIRYG